MERDDWNSDYAILSEFLKQGINVNINFHWQIFLDKFCFTWAAEASTYKGVNLATILSNYKRVFRLSLERHTFVKSDFRKLDKNFIKKVYLTH